MRSISPSPETLQKAFRLGRTLAMSDPSVVPLLDDAAMYPNYVLFLLAHRKKLETLPAFWTWDLRLEDLIEDEIEHHGLSLVPDNVEEILRTIATPLRCAFWYGWESVQNLQKKYEQATGIRTTSTTTEVAASDLQAASSDLGMLAPKASQEPEPEVNPATAVS